MVLVVVVSVVLGVWARGLSSLERESVPGRRGWGRDSECSKYRWSKNIANWMLNLCPWPHRQIAKVKYLY